MAWSRKSYLGPAKIASFVFLVLFKDGGTQGEFLFLMLRYLGGGVSSRFSYVTQKMERLPLDVLRAVKIDNVLWKWVVGVEVCLHHECVEFVIAG